MGLKLDLHIHTRSRGRTYLNAARLRRALLARGLDGAAIVNFFEVDHARRLKSELGEFTILTGQELWTDQGHVLALGTTGRIPDFLPAAQAIARVHDQGGLAVAAHPALSLGLGARLGGLGLDAVETYNAGIGQGIIHNALAARFARRAGLPGVAGSDTSHPDFVGASYTEVLTDDPAQVLDAIRAGRVRLKRRALPAPLGFVVKGLLYFKGLEPCPLHPVPCFACGAGMVIRLFKAWRTCMDCGARHLTRISCANGHFMCLACVVKRENLGV